MSGRAGKADLELFRRVFAECGEHGVYALLLGLQARGKGSGVEIDAEVANVATVEHGRIRRLEMFWDRDAALRAAGA